MKIKKQFVMRTIAGETLLVPVGATTREFNGMITLTETAGFIWENLEKCETEEELVKLILGEFEVDEATAAADAHEFLEELRKMDMIEG